MDMALAQYIAMVSISACIVVAVIAYVNRNSRSLGEMLVDIAFRHASFSTAVAHALDAWLCKYREVRKDIKREHKAMYQIIKEKEALVLAAVRQAQESAPDAEMIDVSTHSSDLKFIKHRPLFGEDLIQVPTDDNEEITKATADKVAALFKERFSKPWRSMI